MTYVKAVLRTAAVFSSVILFSSGLFRDARAQCASCPAGVLSWWRGESNTWDQVGGNSGNLLGNATFGAGEVGSGFVFNGSGGGMRLGQCSNLQVQDFTIEGWIKRTSAIAVSMDNPSGLGFIFSFGNGGYGLYLDSSGYPALTKFGVDNVTLGTTNITDTTFHHLAVTKIGTAVTFFIDGVQYPAPYAYDPGFVFTSSAAIGAGGDSSSYTFWGSIDELAIYDHALEASQIQSIYSVGQAGKCPVDFPPSVTFSPTNEEAYAGGSATFSVSLAGTPPFAYQWLFNGNPLSGATNTALVLAALDPSQAGSYSVQVTNLAGLAVSSPANLTIVPAPPCAAPPGGLVSWWRAEGNGWDQIGGNSGSFGNDVTFGPGESGQGFSFNGAGLGLQVGNPANLQLQDFTIEGWVQTPGGSPTLSGVPGFIFGYGAGGYAFTVDFMGRPALTKVGVNQVSITTGITDTNYHHLAVTKSGANVTFYIDGISYPAASYDPGFDFATGAAIGAGGGSVQNSFLGNVDELAIYNRALDLSEIQAIFNASFSGKCISSYAPFILVGPTNITVKSFGSVTLTASNGGTPPFSYQWLFNNTFVNGATNAFLTLTNLQTSQSGNYSVHVQNLGGSITTNIASINVLPPPQCIAAPAGIVSWWRAESNAWDEIGGNDGTLVGNSTFSPAEVGMGFTFDGQGDSVQIGNPPDLQLQNFTIEGWIRRSSGSAVTHDGNPFGLGFIFSYSSGGYGLYLDGSGRPTLTKFGVNNVSSPAIISDTNLHHLAVTKISTNVVFYVDGIAYPAPPYDPGFTFTTGAAIGIGGSGQTYAFWGTIDELAIYNRALSAAEIQTIYQADVSGKCLMSLPAWIATPPVDETVPFTSNAVINVFAGGTPPLLFQWFFNGLALPGATNNPLILTNLQFSQAGGYSVVVTNAFGFATSSTEHLTVSFPYVLVQAPSGNTAGGVTFSLPIIATGNGVENALGFSLNFDVSKLSFIDVVLGTNIPNAALIVNKTQLGSGKVGMSIALPQGTTLSFGTQQIASVTLKSAISAVPFNTSLSFGDSPTPRQLWDTNLVALAVSFSNSMVTVGAVNSFEADVFPRPNGDRIITLSDWLELGRYVVRLDYPTNAGEFQRADCAPALTAGDGAISVADWVQAGRYSAGLDAAAALGGPTNELAWTGGPGTSNSRFLRITNSASQMAQFTPSVILTAQGNENAVGFSLEFDPRLMSFVSAQPGVNAAGATLFENTNQAGQGILGFALAKNPGETFATGTDQLLILNFTLVNGVQGTPSLIFSDQPALAEVSDSSANSLPVTFAGHVGNANLILSIRGIDRQVNISWPGWGTNFILQELSPDSLGVPLWVDVSSTPIPVSGQLLISLFPTNAAMLYRLRSP